VDLGDYELEGELGRGAFGRVYRARHRPTGAIRAVKILDGVSDVETLDRFRREAQALARVGGRGVVVVHEAGVDRGRLFFAMSLLAGGSLRQTIVREGKLEWQRAVAITAGLARTLERCAAAGLVHRDVKPENVLLDEAREPWLSDFGCVRDLSASRVLTVTGSSVGTPGYMAPEQLRGERATAAADVFALGVLLHELVTGTRPYPGPSAVALLSQALAARPPRASEVPGVPPGLDDVIASALAPEPSKRPAAGELSQRLEALLAGARPEPRSRAGLPVVTAAVVLVVVALAVAARALSPAPTAPSPAPARSDPTPLAPTSAPLNLTKAKAALRTAKLLVGRENLDDARRALAGVPTAELDACPGERKALIDATRRQIDVATNRGSEAEFFDRYVAGWQIYVLLRELAPGEPVPRSLADAARNTLGGGTRFGRLSTEERLTAARVGVDSGPEDVRETLSARWAELVDRALGEPGADYPALLVDSARLVALAPRLAIVHYARGRALSAAAFKTARPDLRSEARQEFLLAHKGEDFVRVDAALWLAIMDRTEGLPLGPGLARIREDWSLRDKEKTYPYNIFAGLLVTAGETREALGILREGARNSPLGEPWFLLRAQELERVSASGDAAALAQLAELILNSL
jgi:hypothetical protein